MGEHIFLALDGIKGEATNKGVEGWINILGFTIEGSKTSSSASIMGPGAPRLDIPPRMTLSKQMDSSTGALGARVANGTPVQSGHILFRKSTGGGAPQVYLQYDLTEVIVDSQTFSAAASNGGPPGERISLTAKSATAIYTELKPDGTPGPQTRIVWKRP